jgi:hypothetical protein
MASPAPASLDYTGTQAAVYPSEEQLWAVGPTINAPAGQGVSWTGAGEQLAPTPTPTSSAQVQATEDYLHEVMNGETSNAVWHENVVNPAVHGPQGFGDWNVQPYESGHSQNIPSNPAAEQGWGVGPARRWAHYPKVESPNPARNEGQHLRNGSLPWSVASTWLYYRTQLAWEEQWSPYKYRRPVPVNVPVAQSVPFVQTVPTFAGGPAPVSALDIPGLTSDDLGVYWNYPPHT